MIVYINGNIGAGKTSLAVSFAYYFFPNKVYDSQNALVKQFFPRVDGVKRDKIKLYTNISGFCFDDFDGHAEFLDFEILEKCALVHYMIHEANRSHKHIDKAINSFFDQCAKGVEFNDLESDLVLTRIKRKYDSIKGFQFNHIVLVIDEVADFFVEGQPHLDKWFNYSRHLFQDMILIQNDLSTIDRAYKNDNVVTNYIKAAEASNRLHPQLFKYAFFRKWTQPISDKPAIKMFWFPKWIFTKYDSGQIEKAFPKIYFYLIPFLALLVFVVVQLYNIVFADDVDAVPKFDSNETVIDDDIENKELISLDENHIVCFTCRYSYCIYKNDIFTFNKIDTYSKIYSFEYLYKEKYSSFSKYCYKVDSSFLDLYKPIVKDSSPLNHFGTSVPVKP